MAPCQDELPSREGGCNVLEAPAPFSAPKEDSKDGSLKKSEQLSDLANELSIVVEKAQLIRQEYQNGSIEAVVAMSRLAQVESEAKTTEDAVDRIRSSELDDGLRAKKRDLVDRFAVFFQEVEEFFQKVKHPKKVCTEQIEKVLAMLESAQEPSTAEMLLKALPHLYDGTRHRYQLQLTEELCSLLRVAHATAREKQASMVSEVDETEASIENLRQEQLEAENREKEAQVANEEQATALASKEQSTREEEEICAKTNAARDAVEQERSWLEKAKAEADSILNESLQPLVQGTWEGEEARDSFLKAVSEYLEAKKNSKVLLAALPKAFNCKPDERRAFSKFAVDEALRFLNEKTSNLGAALEDGTKKFEKVRVEALGAWAIADVARDAQREAVAAKRSAEEAFEEMSSEFAASRSKVRKAELELTRVLSERTLLDAKIHDIDTALAEAVRLHSEGKKDEACS